MQMENLENKWNKKNWKERQLEKIAQSPGRDNLEDIWDWDEYVLENYNFLATPNLSDY